MKNSCATLWLTFFLLGKYCVFAKKEANVDLDKHSQPFAPGKPDYFNERFDSLKHEFPFKHCGKSWDEQKFFYVVGKEHRISMTYGDEMCRDRSKGLPESGRLSNIEEEDILRCLEGCLDELTPNPSSSGHKSKFWIGALACNEYNLKWEGIWTKERNFAKEFSNNLNQRITDSQEILKNISPWYMYIEVCMPLSLSYNGSTYWFEVERRDTLYPGLCEVSSHEVDILSTVTSSSSAIATTGNANTYEKTTSRPNTYETSAPTDSRGKSRATHVSAPTDSHGISRATHVSASTDSHVTSTTARVTAPTDSHGISIPTHVSFSSATGLEITRNTNQDENFDSIISPMTVPSKNPTTRDSEATNMVTEVSNHSYSRSQKSTSILYTDSLASLTPSEIQYTNFSVDATPYTKTSVCKGTFIKGIQWNDTVLGKTAWAPCPGEYMGLAHWHCNQTTMAFDELGPSFEACISSEFDTTENISTVEKLEKEIPRLLEKILDSEDESAVDALSDSIVGVYSDLLSDETKLWRKMDPDTSFKKSKKLISFVEDIGWLLGCVNSKKSRNESRTITKENMELQTLVLSESESLLTFRIKQQHVGSVVLPGGLKSLPPFEKCRMVRDIGIGTVYQKLQDILAPAVRSTKVVMNSDVIGVSLGRSNKTYHLRHGQKVRITLQHTNTTIFSPSRTVTECVFLNWNSNGRGKYGVWDTDGCSVLNSTPEYTVCECDHLTNFAVLMDITGKGFSEADERVLKWLSIVLCCLSSVALMATIAFYISIKSLRGTRAIITCNLAACLLLTNILVQTGLSRNDSVMCRVISCVLQYCILSSFMWMLFEGIHLYRLVITVFQRKGFPMLLIYAVAYGFPFFIVALSSAINPRLLVREKYCWPSAENGFIWSVTGPMAIIITVNTIILFLTLYAASKIKDNRASGKQKYKEKKKTLLKRVKGTLALTSLLGITWGVGFFGVIPQDVPVAAYVFVTLNASQGVLLLVFQFLLNSNVRQLLVKKYKKNAKVYCVSTAWTTLHSANLWIYGNNVNKGNFKSAEIPTKHALTSNTQNFETYGYQTESSTQMTSSSDGAKIFSEHPHSHPFGLKNMNQNLSPNNPMYRD